MPYLIDGHNLIPKIPGLSLRQIDDETRLIELLQEYCRKQRKSVEVFFDRAAPGQAGVKKYGAVTARFVRQGTTADTAIRLRLDKLGRAAANWTVVSSDQAVQNSARLRQARVISSETFASDMAQALEASSGSGERPQPGMTPDELAGWMDLFGGNEDDE